MLPYGWNRRIDGETMRQMTFDIYIINEFVVGLVVNCDAVVKQYSFVKVFHLLFLWARIEPRYRLLIRLCACVCVVCVRSEKL